MSDPLKELAHEWFIIGFNASGEGWNGEYPFADKGYQSNDIAELNARFEEAWRAATS